jgi:Tol biopolymer transport system component
MMKMTRAVMVALAVILITVLAWPALAQGETIELVSVNTDGDQAANGQSVEPSINADGSVVAFASTATDLVEGITFLTDTTGQYYSNIFIRHLLTGDTQLVSVNQTGDEGANGNCWRPSINADGTVVAFQSRATNLVTTPDGNGTVDVFVRYLKDGGSTELVSVSIYDEAGDGGSYEPSISADGTAVAFVSEADDLVASDTNGNLGDIFVRDLENHTTELVSLDSNDNQNTGMHRDPSINADGSVVAFTSTGKLTGEDTDNDLDVYVRDLTGTGSTELVSVPGGGVPVDSDNTWPSINADGSIVAFICEAGLSVSGFEVFVHDRNTKANELVSVHDAGMGIVGYSAEPSISADGQRVAFSSGVPDYGNLQDFAKVNVFVRDRTARATKLLSVGWNGTAANGFSFLSSMSADGQRVAFMSEATNLSKKTDLNGDFDIFVSSAWPQRYPIRHEQTHSRITYTGEWTTEENKQHSGGSIYLTEDPEATITITFRGTSLDWIAQMGPDMGQVWVSIDGGEPVLVDLYSETDLFQQVVWSTGKLDYGVHTIKIYYPEDLDPSQIKPINIDAVDVWGWLLKTTES